MYSSYRSPLYENNNYMSPQDGRRLSQRRSIGYQNATDGRYGAGGYPDGTYRGYYDSQYSGYNNNLYSDYNEPLYFEDRMFDDENLALTARPTWRKSKMLANPDFGNYQFKKGYSAEVWLNDGETVVLSGHSRKKTYRTHYSPEYLRSFFFGWIGRLLRYLYLDRLFGLHIDTVKNVTTKNFIFVTAHLLS